MKPEDMGFFARYADKIAVGVGVFVLLIAVVTQFLLGEPNGVEINGTYVGPGQVEEIVMDQAEQLERKLQAGDSKVPDIDIPPYAESFKKLYQRPIASREPLAVMMESQFLTPIKILEPEYPEYFVPRPPVPDNLLAKAGNGLLPKRNENDPQIGIRQVIGDREPADFPYVSVSGTFDLLQWKLRLEAAERPKSERLPDTYWTDRLMLTSVYLLRQELDPKTGRWVPEQPELIQPLPNQFAVLPDSDASYTVSQAENLQNDLVSNQPLVARPRFPELANGRWTPPDVNDKVFTAEELRLQDGLRRDIARLERLLERQSNPRLQEQRLEELQQKRRDLEAALGVELPPSEFEMPSFDGPENFDADPQFEEDPRFNDRRERPRLRDNRLDAAMGGDSRPVRSRQFNENFRGPGAEVDFGRGNQPGQPNTDSDRVSVWAHDLTVEYGKTYRYKIVATVFNPLFRKSRISNEQREEYFNLAALKPTEEEIAKASWSSPISIDPKYYFFVTGGNIDSKRATIEAWTIFDGIWRDAEFEERPGNEIGGYAQIPGVQAVAAKGVPIRVGHILLDVDSVTGGGPGGNKSVVRAVIFDPKSGKIESRLVDNDKRSDKKLQLENLQREQRRAAEQADSTGSAGFRGY
jgi:hypothetical protein